MKVKLAVAMGAWSPLAVPQAAPAQAAPAEAAQSDCGWNAEISSDAANVLFIDETATYWGATVPLDEGTEIEVRGSFPHARYMSLVV